MIRNVLLAASLALFSMLFAVDADAGPRSINSCGTISKPGSYILSRNINGTAAAGDCIEISTGHVTLNLNGFAIGGPGLVGGVPGGHGVHVLCCDNHNVSVLNGTVIGWVTGVIGDNSTNGLRVERIRAIDNDGVGIYSLGDGAMITNNHVSGSTNDGILFGAGATVMRNISNDNGDDGFHGTCDSVVMFNTAIGNASAAYQITNSANNPLCIVKDNAG